MRSASSAKRPGSGARSLALFIALLACLPAAQARNVFFSGMAIGVVGTAKVDSTSASILVSENQMGCNGVPNEETLLGVVNPQPIGVKARTTTTYTNGRDDTARSESTIHDGEVRLPGLALDVSMVSAKASVHCEWVATHSHPSGLRPVYTVSGGATVGTVSINGEAHAITGAPNQTIRIPDVATVVFNEQVRNSRSLIVNGVHIKLQNEREAASADVVLGYARAKLTCEP